MKVSKPDDWLHAYGSVQQEWNEKSRSEGFAWLKAPSLSPKPILNAEKPDRVGSSTSVEKTPNFTTNEFARLVGVVIDDSAEIRRNLLNSGLTMTRTELDRGTSPDAVWDAKIAPSFNNPCTRVSLDLNHRLSGVDPNAPPLAYRSGAKLLTVFNRSKAAFTKAYNNWRLSGCNNTDLIGDFVSTNAQNQSISEEGRRTMILFFALQCGTPQEDVELIEFTKKTAHRAVSYDDGQDDAAQIRRGGVSRKRSRLAEAELVALQEGNTALKEMKDALLNLRPSKEAMYCESKAKRARDVMTLTLELTKLYDAYEAACEKKKPAALISRLQRSIATTECYITELESNTIKDA